METEVLLVFVFGLGLAIGLAAISVARDIIEDWPPDFIWRMRNATEWRRVDKLRKVIAGLKEGDQIRLKYRLRSKHDILAVFYAYLPNGVFYFTYINSEEVAAVPVESIKSVRKVKL